MRDLSIVIAIVLVVLSAIGIAVPPNSDAAKRYRAILWAVAIGFLAFNILLWRATSLDVVQYGSCWFDSTPAVCAPVRDVPAPAAPAPAPSVAATTFTPKIAAPFPITQSWAGTASTATVPPKSLPKQLTVRIYRGDQSDELLLRFGECVERMQLTASDAHSRTYSTNTDLTLSGGWGSYPYPCWYGNWIEKLKGRDNMVTLSYAPDAPDTMIYVRTAPDKTSDKAATVYRGTLVRD